MQTATYVSILVIVNLFVASVSGNIVGAGQGKHFNKKSGETPNQARDKRSANGNALWSADPDRGWVRSDDQRRVKGGNEPSTHSKENRSKNKPNGKSRKLF